MIYQATGALESELTDYIDELSSSLKVEKESSETPNTLLWSITTPVKAASGKTAGHLTKKLGKPTNVSRWFALVRLWSPWIAPRQGKEKFQPDKEAILAAFERHDGSHLVLLAVSGVGDVLTTFTHDGDGSVVISSQNDCEQEDAVRIIAATGKSLESAMAAVMYHVRRLVMRYEALSGEIESEAKALMEGFEPQWLENWCKSLGR